MWKKDSFAKQFKRFYKCVVWTVPSQSHLRVLSQLGLQFSQLRVALACSLAVACRSCTCVFSRSSVPLLSFLAVLSQFGSFALPPLLCFTTLGERDKKKFFYLH